MWWGERTRVYIGRSTLLMQRGSQQTQAFELEHGLALAGVLARLHRLLPSGTAIELHWSAALCPAVDMIYPAGMTRFADMEAFAQAICAMQLGLATDGVHVRIDPSSPRVVAALTRQDHETVAAWARASSIRLRSMRPLWSVASCLSLARSARAIAVREPDGLTILGSPGKSASQRGMSIPVAASEPFQPLVNRLHQGLGIAPAECLQLGFALPGASIARGSPRCWSSCWTLP